MIPGEHHHEVPYEKLGTGMCVCVCVCVCVFPFPEKTSPD